MSDVAPSHDLQQVASGEPFAGFWIEAVCECGHPLEHVASADADNNPRDARAIARCTACGRIIAIRVTSQDLTVKPLPNELQPDPADDDNSDGVLPPPPNWEQAACTGRTNLFFPDDETDTHAVNHARALCAACPLQTACATWALTTHQPYGIWGGLTASERHWLTYSTEPREPARRTLRARRQPEEPDNPNLTHGRSGYARGCRCAVCLDAEADYTRQHARARQGERRCSICSQAITTPGHWRYCDNPECKRQADLKRRKRNHQKHRRQQLQERGVA